MGVTITYGGYTFGSNTSVANNGTETQELEPTPKVGWNYEYNATSAGRNIGATLRISIEGVYNSTSAYPKTGIPFHFNEDYKSFKIVDDCVGEVFPNNDNLEYDIENGIYVDSINISNSDDEYWRNWISYNIQLVVPLNSGQRYLDSGGDGSMLDKIYISSLDDSMSMSYEDGADYLEGSNTALYPSGGPLSTRYLTITRNISAAGKATKNKPAVSSAIEAVQKVKDHTSFEDLVDKTFANLKFFDKSTSHNYDAVAGTYAVTDTYKAFSGEPTKFYTHEYNISNNIDSQLNRTVSINGTIQGYNLTDPALTDVILSTDPNDSNKSIPPPKPEANLTNSSYINASGGFTDEIQLIKDRVLFSAFYPSGKYIERIDGQQTNYEGFKLDQSETSNTPKMERQSFLNPIPASFDASHDINQGSISYTCSYDNRPIAHVPGAITEEISVKDTHSYREHYSQNVMYRGAIMQTLGMNTIPSRTVTYTAKFGPNPTKGADGDFGNIMEIADSAAVNNAIDQFDPKLSIPNFTRSWVVEDSQNGNFIDGTFSKTKTWSYTN